MNRLRFAILQGLAQSGRQKSLSQILSDEGLEYTPKQLLAAVQHLEILGLIQKAEHRLDVTAELTYYGKDILQAAQSA